jgi:hypothetical protein
MRCSYNVLNPRSEAAVQSNFSVKAHASTAKAPAYLLVTFRRGVEPVMQEEIRDLFLAEPSVQGDTCNWLNGRTLTVAIADGVSRENAKRNVQGVLERSLTFS